MQRLMGPRHDDMHCTSSAKLDVHVSNAAVNFSRIDMSSFREGTLLWANFYKIGKL